MFKHPNNLKSQNKRSFILRPAQTIILGFLAIILLGTFLIALPVSTADGAWTNFIDSLYTATSAVCVTGLTSVSTALHFTVFGQIVILLLIQIGGLGVMTMTTFIMLLIRKKISFRDRVALQSAMDRDTTKGIVKLVRSILIMTFSIEFIGFLIFLPILCPINGAIGVWQSLFLSVSAFCNAGFDLFGTAAQPFCSLENFSSNTLLLLSVSMLIIIGGIGFSVVADIFLNRSKKKKLSIHTKVVLLTTAILLVGGTAFFLGTEYHNPLTLGNRNIGNKLLLSFFQSVTARTAGFTAIDQNLLYPEGKVFTGILMFIGASPGGTGGGIKTSTVALLIITLFAVLRGKTEIVAFKHKINNRTILKAFSTFFFAICIVFMLAIFILIVERDNVALHSEHQYSFINIFYESLSAFSTTGFSTGLTPYLSDPSKIASIIVMFVGRIGLMNFGYAFFIDRYSTTITYPESNISVG